MCNLCEVVVDHWDIVLNFIHDHLKADLLSVTQKKYFSLLENPFIQGTMKALKLVSEYFLRPYMQFGNTTKSSTDYLKLFFDRIIHLDIPAFN
jgi:hypothetical protein